MSISAPIVLARETAAGERRARPPAAVSSHPTRDLSATGKRSAWVVERLDIDGEELPIVRHGDTWLPAPLAKRYVLRTRFRVGPAALVVEARAIAHLYNWSEEAFEGTFFEDFLMSGEFLVEEELAALAQYLWRDHRDEASTGRTLGGLVCNQTYNARLCAVQNFLQWAHEPMHHGGKATLDLSERDRRIASMIRQLEKEKLIVPQSDRQEPLTFPEIALIRKAIGPDTFGNFPADVFSESTRCRNYCMFETVLNTGARKSEMLVLRRNDLRLTRGGNEGVMHIPRQQDEPEDPRTRHRPRCKTNEREVSLMDQTVLPTLLRYRDSPPPIGRNDPRFTTPYLFVTETGAPLSKSAADYVIERIGYYAARELDRDPTVDENTRTARKKSLHALAWHRLRHTWSESAALGLYRRYGGAAWALLQVLGGWNNPNSMQRYIGYAMSEIASGEMRECFSSRNTGRKHHG